MSEEEKEAEAAGEAAAEAMSQAIKEAEASQAPAKEEVISLLVKEAQNDAAATVEYLAAFQKQAGELMAAEGLPPELAAAAEPSGCTFECACPGRFEAPRESAFPRRFRAFREP